MCSSFSEICCQAYGVGNSSAEWFLWSSGIANEDSGSSAAALALKLFPFISLSPARGITVLDPLLSKYPLYSQAFLLFGFGVFFLIISLMDKCLVHLFLSILVAVESLCLKSIILIVPLRVWSCGGACSSVLCPESLLLSPLREMLIVVLVCK